MKKFFKNILLITIFVINSGMINSVNSQVTSKNSHHIRIGSGYPNVPLLFTTFIQGFCFDNCNDNIIYENSSLGPFLGYYDFFPGRKLSFGLLINYSSSESKIINKVDKIHLSTINLSFNIISSNINFHYLKKDRSDLYSGISLGLNLISLQYIPIENQNKNQEKETFKELFWHINGLGFKQLWGNHWGAYLELGYGYNGGIIGGINYTL